MDGHTFTLVIWDSEAKEKVKMKYKPTLMNPAFCPLWTVWKWLVMSEKSRYETSLRFRPSRTSHLHCSGRPEQKQKHFLYLYIYPAFPYKNPQNNIKWSVRAIQHWSITSDTQVHSPGVWEQGWVGRWDSGRLQGCWFQQGKLRDSRPRLSSSTLGTAAWGSCCSGANSMLLTSGEQSVPEPSMRERERERERFRGTKTHNRTWFPIQTCCGSSGGHHIAVCSSLTC